MKKFGVIRQKQNVLLITVKWVHLKLWKNIVLDVSQSPNAFKKYVDYSGTPKSSKVLTASVTENMWHTKIILLNTMSWFPINVMFHCHQTCMTLSIP